MKSHYVKDLLQLEVGEHFCSPFRLAKAEQRKKNDGGVFLTLELQDCTGRIEAKWWTCTERDCEKVQQYHHARVSGKVHLYNGRREVHFAAPPDWLPEPEDASDYELTALLPLSELRKRLDAHIASVQAPYLRALLELVFGDEKFRARFDQMPGAQSRHHACRHGLLQHTLEVTDLAAAIAGAQGNWGYAAVACDLVVTGALLHDIGKVHELIASSDGDYSMSRMGMMLGHITIGIQLVSKKINEIKGFPAELKDALMHIVESHHGKKEFGSPIPPLFAEAQIVHMADLLNVQLFYMQEAAQSATEEFVTVRKMDNQRLYTRPWESLHLSPETGVKEIAEVVSPVWRGTSLPFFRFQSGQTGDSTSFQTRRLPLVGRAAAGLPKFAEQHIEEYYEVEDNPLFPTSEDDVFLLQVAGDSMTGDGIRDQNIIVVRRQEHHEKEEVVVVFLADREEAAIKRVQYNRDGTVSLLSSNPTYAPLKVPDPGSLRICGRVLGLLQDAVTAASAP